MNQLTNALWMSPDWMQRLAGSLLHFLWQGAALAFAAAVLLRMLRRRSAESRYAAAVTMLGLMLAAPCLTFVFYPETGGAALALMRFLSRSAAEAGRAAGTANTAAWTAGIVTVWMAGVAVCGVRLMAGWILSLGLIRSANAAVPAGLDRLIQRVQSVLLNGRSVRLLVGDRVDTPIVFGWLRPVVLLPAAAITGLTEDQLLAVLAHEIAHVRRHDFLVNALQRGVESVLFYHPAVWWLSARIRAEREHCCDDMAVSVCGDRFVYAQALIELERARAVEPALAVPAAAGRLTERIRRLLGVETANRDWQPALAALLLIAACALAGAWQTESIAAPGIAPVLLIPPPFAVRVEPAPDPPAGPQADALSALAAIATAQAQQPAAVAEHWVTTWGERLMGPLSSLDDPTLNINNQTLRMFMRVSIGGRRIRVHLSNAFGSFPLFLGQVRVAVRDRGSEIVPGSDRQVLFAGRGLVEIPVGETMVSDAVNLDVPALSEIAISIYSPNETGPVSGQADYRTGYLVSGNQASAVSLTGAKLMRNLSWVTAIDVAAQPKAGAVMIVGGPGSHAVDGAHGLRRADAGARDANRTWPTMLAARLQATDASKDVAVVMGPNESMIGQPNPPALDQILKEYAGTRWLMLCPDFTSVAYRALDEKRTSVSFERATDLLKNVIDRAHALDLKVIGCTMNPLSILPDVGRFEFRPTAPLGAPTLPSIPFEPIRIAVNDWVRSSGAFDHVVDFDAVARDAALPDQVKADFGGTRNSNNWVQSSRLNDAGLKALANSIDLAIFAH